MSIDPIDEFLRAAASQVPASPASESDLFDGSEPVPSVPPAAPDPRPGPDVPANSAPAIVADVANTSIEAALAELIRRVQAIEVALRRNGADL